MTWGLPSPAHRNRPSASASTTCDGSPAIAGGFDGIEVLAEAKTGAYAARNTGIRAASAPIIALTDADCVVEPGWLGPLAALDGVEITDEILVEALRAARAAIVSNRAAGRRDFSGTNSLIRTASTYSMTM